MGLVLLPEVKMARRVIKKHALEVPFNITQLVKEYADVIYKNIPIDGVDGICLHLKTPGKKPRVIVNLNSTATRQNFTLAHELGHIIIPWHCGAIIDEVEKPIIADSTYWTLEREANRFASELLMPFDWVHALYQKNSSKAYLLPKICWECNVSEAAANIRLNQAVLEIELLLMPLDVILEIYEKSKDLAVTQQRLIDRTGLNYKRVAELMVRELPFRAAFAIETDNKVFWTGGSPGTHTFFQFDGASFVRSPYTLFANYSVLEIGRTRTHWWTFKSSFNIPDDSRSWRDLLDKIASDISAGKEKQFKASVQGRISGAHSAWLRKNPFGDLDEFIVDCIYRFNHPDARKLVEHPNFFALIKKRGEEFYRKR